MTDQPTPQEEAAWQTWRDEQIASGAWTARHLRKRSFIAGYRAASPVGVTREQVKVLLAKLDDERPPMNYEEDNYDAGWHHAIYEARQGMSRLAVPPPVDYGPCDASTLCNPCMLRKYHSGPCERRPDKNGGLG